ncbi:MAG: hypothetical protein WD011_04535 [Nitriliruptoraceae bacterium]
MDDSPRDLYRALTRTRSGYDGVIHDVQLQVVGTGALLWAQSFSDAGQANEFQAQLEHDLESMDLATFRRRYGIPSSG